MKDKSGEIKRESLQVLDAAHAQCEKKIEMTECRAEKLCGVAREEAQLLHAETEIVLAKLQAVVESHSECLKKSQNVFEDHDDIIHNILNDSVKKNEIFEDTNYKMKYAQESLEKQTNKKFEDLENKVRTVESQTRDLKETDLAKVNLLVNKNLFISTIVPVLGVLFLCFWVHILTVTLPDTIFQETNPTFVDIKTKMNLLNNGIRTTDSETFLELQAAKKSVETLERNIGEKIHLFSDKMTRQFSMLEEKIESYEDSVDIFNGDIDSLRVDLSEQFSNFQSGIIEQFTEASIRCTQSYLSQCLNIYQYYGQIQRVHDPQDLDQPRQPQGRGGEEQSERWSQPRPLSRGRGRETEASLQTGRCRVPRLILKFNFFPRLMGCTG